MSPPEVVVVVADGGAAATIDAAATSSSSNCGAGENTTDRPMAIPDTKLMPLPTATGALYTGFRRVIETVTGRKKGSPRRGEARREENVAPGMWATPHNADGLLVEHDERDRRGICPLSGQTRPRPRRK